MSRQEIVSKLKIIREGIRKKDQYLFEKISEYQYEKYMDYIPKKPLPPKKVKKPSNEFNRFFEPRDINEKREHYDNDPRDVDFRFEEWQLCISIVALALAIFIAIMGLAALSDSRQRGITILIVAGGMAAVVPVMILISLLRFINQKRIAINGIPKQDEEYREYLIRLNASNKEKQEKALIDYAEYEKKLDEYKKLQNQFREKMRHYEKEYNDQKEIALNKIRNINKDLENKANKAFEDALKKANIDYPEKYYSNISAIIDIFEDMRADTLKEAIAVMLDDEHKQTLETEARLAMLSQKGMQQCSQCSRKYTCGETKDNDGSCRLFRK